MEIENSNPTFYFPFQPYAIQEKFMRELYFTLENGKHGIFESPTGTGKSLSICCSALQWLKDYNKKVICDLENQIKTLQQELLTVTDDKDWLVAEYEKIQKNQSLASLQLKLDKIKKYNEKFVEMKVRVEKQKNNSERKPKEFNFQNVDKSKTVEFDSTDNVPHDDEDADLILDEIDDKEENETDEDVSEQEEEDTTKIYISSRTHSQLSQFVGEIKRTVFKDNTRVVTLASRQHYCINPNVSKLKNINLINERCLDMQKSKSKATATAEDGKVIKKTKTKSCAACPYYSQSNIDKLKEKILCDIMDMEDLVKNGKETKACPYYASRAALKDAEEDFRSLHEPPEWLSSHGTSILNLKEQPEGKYPEIDTEPHQEVLPPHLKGPQDGLPHIGGAVGWGAAQEQIRLYQVKRGKALPDLPDRAMEKWISPIGKYKDGILRNQIL
ncbi:hypothetical protein evm_012911 [Chilo suppressalis]|nr:hypothetical protein evm_012911 [Chilo suppressalis]